jgi:hypothetical protein
MSFSDRSKQQVTVYGRRNWDRLVSLASCAPGDAHACKVMADALAALVSEVTPFHREVLASQFTVSGARGRMHTHVLPPGLGQATLADRERWAALVLLDCVDFAADALSRDHSLVERQGWRAAAEAYTCGAERLHRNP